MQSHPAAVDLDTRIFVAGLHLSEGGPEFGFELPHGVVVGAKLLLERGPLDESRPGGERAEGVKDAEGTA